MYTLLPYLVKIERSADRWLFKAGERGRYVVRFNYDGLLRADSEGRSKLESVWLQNGVVSRNQVRALENMPRSDAPGMDDYTVQSNMISVDELQAIADAMRKNGGKTSGATQ
jgi:phage portal protein BeeE